MAVELMGNGDQVPAQMNRTIFKDVPATHWARGYIAVATQSTTSGSGENASTTPGIIRGDAYGNFNPDRAITYGQASVCCCSHCTSCSTSISAESAMPISIICAA